MIRTIGFAGLSLLVGVLLLPTPAAEQATLEVGFGERDVTPKVDPKGKPVYLAGFGTNRKATGVHDPLYARAVVFADGKSKVALVSVDVVGLFLDFVEEVRKQLPDFTFVVVTSTHNHEGPDTLGIWGPSPLVSGIDKEYQARLRTLIVEAVQEADQNRKPASASLGSVKAPELLHDSRLPIVLHEDLVVLRFKDVSTGKNSGIVVQWNNHPETLADRNTLISADYVGYTVNHLKKKYDCPVVYVTGTVGGLMTSLRVPIKNDKGEELKDGTYEKTERYGELLGLAASKAFESSTNVALTPIEARSKSIYLPLANKLYVVGRQLGVFQREAFLWNDDPKKIKPVTDIIDPKLSYGIRSEVGYVRLGDLEVACIPGEIYPELVLDKVVEKAERGADFPNAQREPAIYKQLKRPHKMLIGLANDEIGYVIPLRQWDEKPPFAYGRKKSQYGEINSLGPETAPRLTKAFADLVAGK